MKIPLPLQGIVTIYVFQNSWCDTESIKAQTTLEEQLEKLIYLQNVYFQRN